MMKEEDKDKKREERDKKNYVQRYRQAWEDDPRFQGWLQHFPGDETKARCKICETTLQSHVKSLIGHSTGKKHLSKMAKMCGSQPQYFGPKTEARESMNEEDHYNNVSEEHSSSYAIEVPYSNFPPKQFKHFITCSRGDSLAHQHSSTNHKIIERVEDELDIFGKSIIAQMRTLPEDYIVTLTSEIQNLVSQKRLKAMANKICHSQTRSENSQSVAASYGNPPYHPPQLQPDQTNVPYEES